MKPDPRLEPTPEQREAMMDDARALFLRTLDSMEAACTENPGSSVPLALVVWVHRLPNTAIRDDTEPDGFSTGMCTQIRWNTTSAPRVFCEGALARALSEMVSGAGGIPPEDVVGDGDLGSGDGH